MSEYLLEIKGVLLEETSKTPLSLALRGGDSVLLQGDDPAWLFDVLQGIEEPHAGSVEFRGSSWAKMTPFRSCRCRGLMARTFSKPDLWVQNLTLRQNIELRSLHHNLQNPAELERDMESFARELNLTEALDKRPEVLAQEELALAQFLRLFCRKTEVILLDNPPENIKENFLPVLNKWLNTFISGGGVVIMATAEGKSEAAGSYLSSTAFTGYIRGGDIWMEELKR